MKFGSTLFVDKPTWKVPSSDDFIDCIDWHAYSLNDLNSQESTNRVSQPHADVLVDIIKSWILWTAVEAPHQVILTKWRASCCPACILASWAAGTTRLTKMKTESKRCTKDVEIYTFLVFWCLFHLFNLFINLHSYLFNITPDK